MTLIGNAARAFAPAIVDIVPSAVLHRDVSIGSSEHIDARGDSVRLPHAFMGVIFAGILFGESSSCAA
jgi:hypothetical protein